MNLMTPSGDPRVLLVTGGGSGIGAAVAQRAAHDGWTVVITGRRPEPLDAIAASVAGVRAIPADMSRGDEVDRVVGALLDDVGRIDAVVANAGVMGGGSLAETPPDEWDRIMSVNLRGVYLLARACLPALRASRGSLVGVGSIAGMRAPAGASAYAVSKAALSMLISTIAVDEAPHGVRANVVNPGWVRTEMADGEMAEFGGPLGLDLDDAYDAMTVLVPQRRAALPHEVAAAVMWLAGDDSSYVNGAVLTVDGGTTLVDPGTVPFSFDVRERP